MTPGPARPCPPPETLALALAAEVLGASSPTASASDGSALGAEARTALRHAATCERCAAVVAHLRRVERALRDGPPPAVPDDLRAAVAELPERPEWERSRPAESVGSAADSGPVPALRGEALTAAHRLYRVGDYDLDLALLEDRALTGQVLPATDAAAPLVDAACVLEGDATVRQAPIGPFGEFCIEAVAPGRYRLVIETEDRRLVLEELDLSAESELR